MSVELSVVLATYNRGELLERLLEQLARQTLPADRFEVVVVDDGSTQPAEPRLTALSPRLSYALHVETQANAGPAAARHRAVQKARGRVIVIIDDDMQVPPEFLSEHLMLHPAGTRRLVLGQLRQDLEMQMPLHERWHLQLMSEFSDRVRAGVPLRGNNVYTGNVSFLRADYLEVGGFDASLKRSEDAELGLRFEKLGVEFLYSDRAYVIHCSDHTSTDNWRRRAFLYGIFDRRIARKHPEVEHADPWRYWFELNPLMRPLLMTTLVAPERSGVLGGAVYRLAEAADRFGLSKVAMKGATLAYGIDYFRGLRTESGSFRRAMKDLGAHGKRRFGSQREGASPRSKPVRRFLEALRADYGTLRHYEQKYGGGGRSSGRYPVDVVQKVGLQMMVAYRLMRLFREADVTLGAKVMSRFIRHVYSSDIHWDAQFAPGVLIVHGMGMAISHAAVVGSGCILFQHVTLGFSSDPRGGDAGAPTLGENVHVMPGATLTGPISVGDRTKVMANVVLTRSVPPDCLVEAPNPTVRTRGQGAVAEGEEPRVVSRRVARGGASA